MPFALALKRAYLSHYPPYVRYQLQQKDYRLSLQKKAHEQVERIPHLDATDKAMFLRLIDGYSGLSDLAVPSWILCSALVKMGGYLAIVVPDTWLSREYAKPIQYLLSKSFDVLTIVKDVSASWFDNALVRTCLLVAKRRATAPLKDVVEKKTRYIELGAETIGSVSLIDNLKYDKDIGSEALAKILNSSLKMSGSGFAASTERTLNFFPHMLSDRASEKWATREDNSLLCPNGGHPIEMLPVIKNDREISYITLESLGIHCGQGLRTGANDFFYLTIDEENCNNYVVHSKPWYRGSNPLIIPNENLIKTLQNRAEANSLVVAFDNLKTGLLLIQNEVKQADLKLCSSTLDGLYRPLSKSLSDYITSAELYRNARGVAFKEFSAVAPNEKKDNEGHLRFWYMLPPLSKRHLPAMCINRINPVSASCLYIPQSTQKPIVVDANFVTLWGNTPMHEASCLALLNSTWSKCYLECLCTVMGGGALKIETSHIRKLQFPRYSSQQIERLAKCGEQIIAIKSMTTGLQAEIDAAVLEPFKEPELMLVQLKTILRNRLSERGAKL